MQGGGEGRHWCCSGSKGLDMTMVVMGVLAQPLWNCDCNGAMAKKDLENWPISDNGRLSVYTRKKK
jgi:hypothetical protein